MSDASIPHIIVLVVNIFVRPVRAWGITLTTHAQNAIRMLKCVMFRLLSTGKPIISTHRKKQSKHSCRRLKLWGLVVDNSSHTLRVLVVDNKQLSATKYLVCGDPIIVSALESESSRMGSSSHRNHCVVLLGKTSYTHSASLASLRSITGHFFFFLRFLTQYDHETLL